MSQLSLYDIVHTPGVAADLSHIDTPAKVEGFNGAENLETALAGADVVIIPAGVPRKPGKHAWFFFLLQANQNLYQKNWPLQSLPYLDVLIFY